MLIADVLTWGPSWRPLSLSSPPPASRTSRNEKYSHISRGGRAQSNKANHIPNSKLKELPLGNDNNKNSNKKGGPDKDAAKGKR
jgi:hypothetical protein